MEIGGYEQALGIVKIYFGEAVSSDFARMLALFSAAAWVHSRKVGGEIRIQLSALTDVLRQDLDHQKKVVGEIRGDVDKIKTHLKLTT